MFVGHVLLRGQREVLVDHLDAACAPFAGGGVGHVLAVKQDAALIYGIDAGQALHQRRFASAVIAHETDHLARSTVRLTPAAP